MPLFFYGFDPTYWLIMIVGLVLSLSAAGYVKAAFARAAKVPLSSGMRGVEIAQQILRSYDISDVRVVEHQGFLSDHYNPMNRTLALSPQVYHGRSAAAAGVAAHEVGHAIQHARGYIPMYLRSLLVPVASIGSNLGIWLVIAGILLGSASQAAEGSQGFAWWLAVIGVVLFGSAALFALVTVPVEFNASSRAKTCLMQLGVIRPGTEEAQVSRVLTAAGLTYVAAAITALLQLLYWAWRAGLIGGSRD